MNLILIIALAFIFRGIKKYIDVKHMTEEELLFSMNEFFSIIGLEVDDEAKVITTSKFGELICHMAQRDGLLIKTGDNTYE